MTPFPLSPLLPDEPDWEAMAKECALAYSTLTSVSLKIDARTATGEEYWNAHARIDDAVSKILSWSKEPELYGRLLAYQRILMCAHDKDTVP